jgi:GAF domain-containing protein
MPPAPLPQNESERYIALMAYRARGLVADVRAVQLVREAKEFFGLQQAVIALVGRTKVYFLAEVGAGFDSLPREHSFCTYAIHNQTPLVVEDTRLDPRFSDNPSVAGPPWVRFYAGAPLVDAEGYCLGTFCLVDLQHGEGGVFKYHFDYCLGTFCLVDLQPHSLKPAEISRLVHFSQRAMRLIEMQKATSALLGTYNAPPAGHVATGGYAASPP